MPDAPQHAEAAPVTPENARMSLSSIDDRQPENSISFESPTQFLQKENRLPYLQQQENHCLNQQQQQQQQQQRFMEDVSSQISTLTELIA